MLDGSANGFFGVQPEWTLAGRTLSCSAPGAAVLLLDQRPFHWAAGMWESEVLAINPLRSDPLPRRVLVRVAPETLRRWRAVAIDPIVEACAQLAEHLQTTTSRGELSLLILL